MPSPSARPNGSATPRRRRDRLARWAVPAALVAMLGLLVGSYARLVSEAGRAYTGSRVAPRPAASRFAPPFRLLGRVNVLLIGTDITLDNRRRVLPVSRSDTLMLLSFDPAANRIFALSIPRDTRAAIPGHGETKINAAYAYGGVDLTMRTVQEFLGVPVPYYITMPPKGFAALIDALGGLEIDVERDMYYVDHWAGLKIDLRRGRQRLTGEQAMGYARFRKDALGDIGRVRRQQQVLRTLIARLRENDAILRTPALMAVLREHAETNLTPPELLTLGWFARFRAGDWSMATLAGSFGETYWEPNWPRVRRVVAEYFYGVAEETLAATTVEVLNASGVPGVARRTASRLERLGIRIVRVANAPPQDASQVIVHGATSSVADLIAQLLGLASTARERAGSDVDVTVIVARDLAARASSPGQ